MVNIKGTLRTCLLLLLFGTLMLYQGPARASWSKTDFDETYSFVVADLGDEVTPYHAIPASRREEAYSLGGSDRDPGTDLWGASEVYPYPYLVFQSPRVEVLRPDRPAGTCIVSSTADSGPNTLRQCLTDAVASDEITFDPTTFLPGTPATISLATPLPYITVDNLTIDASNAGVILDGSALTGNNIGLRIDDYVEGITIRGLQIVNFYLGILLDNAANNTIGGDRAVGVGPMGQGNLISGNSYAGMQLQLPGTTNNAILGNFIGTDLSGTSAYGNTNGGIVILYGPSQNVIGGSHSAGVCDGPCNLISGSGVGVVIYSGGSEDNEVLGNFIGSDLSGDNSIGSQEQGVLVGDEASQNVIGGTHTAGVCDGPCNLISGHSDAGVAFRDSGTTGNQVLGNFIGTDSSGNSANGNSFGGVVIAFGASHNVIGGSHSPGVCDDTCNLISGSPYVGIQLQNPETTNNEVLGNFIGTDLAGNSAIGNAHGIRISSQASQNVIGGAHSPGICDGPCNLISGNIFHGVVVLETDTNSNQILGNFVGTNAAGDAALPNDDGLEISLGASDTQIGGAGTGEGNLISGNTDRGICFWDAGTTGSQVLGNFIGTNAAGDDSISNNHGITIGEGASDTQVGGTGTGEGNLISGNTNMGVWMDSQTTTGNQVLGNLIGTDISGDSDLPNYHGVLISTGSTSNQIGNATPGGGNLISGNEYAGVWMEYVEAPGNTIAGNKIGTNLSGTGAVPNYIGIQTTLASSNLIGGTESGGGNLISGNWDTGLYMDGGNLNLVQGNTIGTDLAGEVALPNLVRGMIIGFGASGNTIGGTVPGSGNLISGNGSAGIHIQNETSLNNHIQGNRIGTNRSGTSPLPNEIGVLLIQVNQTIIGGADTSTPWVCDGPCNLISGNSIFGISFQGISPGGSGRDSQREYDPALVADQLNQVMGNFIGTDPTGTTALPNQYGVNLTYEAAGNTIGGSSLLGEGNLISGNQGDGIKVTMPQTTNNRISGNRIGTTADGEAALPNGGNGVWITEGASSNTVGGEDPGQGNLISGQATGLGFSGVVISTASQPEAIGNQIIGNLLGTNHTGTSAIPNGGGVVVANLVTDTLLRDNLISGNSLRGIMLLETTGNEVRDNNIGVAADGVTPLPNGEAGITIGLAPQNTIGPGNTVAYNQYGVAIVYPESVGNTITQNSIFANTDEQIGFFEVPQPLAPAPVLTGWDGAVLSGTACAACQVEIFANEDPEPAGQLYLDTVTAAGDGTFNLAIGSGYRYLAATATDGEGTTSEFSNSLFVGTYATVYLPLIVSSSDQP
jgi:parallel beta-helix repeat protein